MPKKILEIKDNDGNPIYVEAEVDESSLEMVAGSDGLVLNAISTIEKSLDPAVTLMSSLIRRVSTMGVEQPTELELQFALSLSGNMNFWVVTGSGQGTINLRMKWSKP